MNLISCEKLEKSMVELQFSIDAETFKAAVNNAFKREGKKYAIPGFRKGKAPRHMIEKMYGSDIFHYDAVNDLFPEAYEAAVKEAKIDVVGRPDPEVVSMSEADGVVLKVKVAVKPEVELGEYAGLTVTKEAKNVNEADVDAEVKRMQDRNGRLLTREGAAENGDTVDIDFEGFVDGKAFEGGKAEHHELTLGSGAFIPGFEDQLIGCKAGDEKDVVVTFPEEYHAEELKGKDATFKIKLHQIKRKELPTLDDEFAKDVSEFDTLDEYKNSLREKLQSDREKQEEMNVENQIFDALIEKVQGEIPEEMYEQEVEESINNFAYRLQSQGLNLETYLKYTGMDVNAIKEQFRPQSEKQLKLRLALEKIAELENLEVSDEAVEEEYEKLAKQYNMEVAQIKNLVAETQIRADLKNQKAIDFVKENASVKAEKPAKKTTRRKSTKKAAEEKTEETAEAKTEE
mgnify:CR=1 FL=1